MISLLRKVIPWQKSLSSNRTSIDFWVRIGAAELSDKRISNAVQYSINPLLAFGGTTEDGRTVSNGQELYSVLKINTVGNGAGNYISIKDSVNGVDCHVSITSGENRDFDAMGLIASINVFSVENAESIIKSVDVTNFHSAYLIDSEYVGLQKQNSLKRYKYTGGLQLKANTIDNDWVDTSGRPGKGGVLPDQSGHLETGGAHFWFGELIYPAIPQERILSFDQAHEIRVLDNGVVYVNLYEGTFNGHLPENQAKQLAFRDHLGLIRS